MRRPKYGAALGLSAVALAVAVYACGSQGPDSQFLPPVGDGGDGADHATATCVPPASACGASCVDTSSDPGNCGTCGNACMPSELCCAATCVGTAACGFAVRGAAPIRGNQNGGDYITLAGDGFVPGMQVFIGDGLAPALTLDAHSALVQTPPAGVGLYDIKIVAGASTATFRKGFSYVAGGILLPWQEKPMSQIRGEQPALAVMQDGRVLVAGGTAVPDSAVSVVDTAEIYTRSTDQVVLAAGKMSTPRWRGSAITLLTGKVLVVGGADTSKLADLFDPATNKFTPTANPLNTARGSTRSVLMTDGTVMIASETETTAEIYDPATDGFTQIPLVSSHTFGFMVRLRDGRVMLGGGDGGVTAVEIYDLATKKFAAAAPLLQGRSMLTAHTLPDGHVMVIGGASISAGAVNLPLDEIELYDAQADKWSVAPYKLTSGRTWQASALVRDGTILVMGGYTTMSCAPSSTVDQIDPVKKTVIAFGTLPHPNTEWWAVTLLDGSVLGVGGGACGGVALPDLDFLPGAPPQK